MLRSSISNPNKAWALVDEGNLFLENQCLAIVEAMNLPAHLHRVSLPGLWRTLPLWSIPNLVNRVHSTPKPLRFSQPSFIICGGKIALKIGSYFKKKNETFIAALGPTTGSFHKIILENHIQEEKRNIINTLGPLHRIHPDVLFQARIRFYRKIDHLPKPRIGIFLEGNECLKSLIKILPLLFKKNFFSLMIHAKTLSEENKYRLTRVVEKIPHLLWQGQAKNPYLGFLSHSDALIVSNSSSLLVAEGTSVAKPLFIYPHFSLSPYIQTLIQKGYASLLTKDSFLHSYRVFSPLQEA